MTAMKIALAALFIACSTGGSWAGGDADPDARGASLAQRDCAWCHGTSQQGYATAPRIAGQKSEYIESQLRSFRTHSRDNPKSMQYMWGAAASVGGQSVHAIALYLSALKPEPAEDGDASLTERGHAVYRDGLQEANIPSCVACHGPNGEGVGSIPRLGGLSYDYLKRKLAQWGEGYHAAAAAPMPGVASKLSTPEIEAISSYLSFVK
jgi:cytochrome c553